MIYDRGILGVCIEILTSSGGYVLLVFVTAEKFSATERCKIRVISTECSFAAERGAAYQNVLK